MTCSSPRARAGFIIVEASIAPSAPPAPTIWWISSRKRMISPSRLLVSSITACRRSSNSPRNFEPATSAPMSSAMTRLSRRFSGTSPMMIFWARPSTIAVLPTPASPMITGLFFERRFRTCMTRRISSSRPITGSSLPCLRQLREVDRVLLQRAVVALGARTLDAGGAADLLQRLVDALLVDAGFAAGCAPNHPRARPQIAIRMCSMPTYSSLRRSASAFAVSSKRTTRGVT